MNMGQISRTSLVCLSSNTPVKFSPFELLYGHAVRGPMTIRRKLWTNEDWDSKFKTSYQYALDRRNRREETCEIAKEELSQEVNKDYYDSSAKPRSLKVGDKVLLLLPTEQN